MSEQFSEEMTNRFKPFEARMQTAGLHPIVIESFRHCYNQLVKGKSGLISRLEIDPVDDIPDAETLDDYSKVGRTAMKKAEPVIRN